VPIAELCRRHGVSDASIYKWKAKYGGMAVSETKRLRTLEEENAKLKRMLADAKLDNVALKDLRPLTASGAFRILANSAARLDARSGSKVRVLLRPRTLSTHS
jgi:putative transposase